MSLYLSYYEKSMTYVIGTWHPAGLGSNLNKIYDRVMSSFICYFMGFLLTGLCVDRFLFLLLFFFLFFNRIKYLEEFSVHMHTRPCKLDVFIFQTYIQDTTIPSIICILTICIFT